MGGFRVRKRKREIMQLYYLNKNKQLMFSKHLLNAEHFQILSGTLDTSEDTTGNHSFPLKLIILAGKEN